MTEHYVGIGIHKTESQVAVIDELGESFEEVRVKKANLDEIIQKYAGSEAGIEAESTTSRYTTDSASISKIRNRKTIAKTRRTLCSSCG